MYAPPRFRLAASIAAACIALVAPFGVRQASAQLLSAQSTGAAIAPSASPVPHATGSNAVVLNRVVAEVNGRAILASDVDDEMRLSVLEPASQNDRPDSRGALDRLISRNLIQLQIRREEEKTAAPSDDDVRTRVQELRKQLPVCVRANCVSDSGWAAFLAANGLTEAEVEEYFRTRLEVLNFIENRFREGIRITQDDIEQYYSKTLVPQYPSGQPIPSLESVSARIEEILLQQKVNVMFGTWLDNLRKQGDVEFLDPSLEAPASAVVSAGAGS